MKTPDDTTAHHFIVHNRRYFYTLKKLNDGQVYMACEAAGIHRKLDPQQLLTTLTNLSRLITEYRKQKRPISTKTLHFRVTPEDKAVIEQQMAERGYPSVASFARAMMLGETQTRPYGFEDPLSDHF